MGGRLSVVVISLAGGAQTRRCVAALRREAPDQLLVVPRRDQPDPGHAQVIRAPTDFVPVRRLAGARAADGDWLAFIEDTTEVNEGWADCARRLGRQADAGALSGPVCLDGRLPARELALGITEYAAFAGLDTAHGVPGNAFLLRGDLIDDPVFSDGIYEDRVTDVLESAGLRQVTDDGLGVVWSGGDVRTARLGARIRHGRLFGARRLRHVSPMQRLWLRLGSPALLVWLPARGTLRALHLGFARALPQLVVMESARALGEIAGYWLGPGRAAEVWH